MADRKLYGKLCHYPAEGGRDLNDRINAIRGGEPNLEVRSELHHLIMNMHRTGIEIGKEDSGTYDGDADLGTATQKLMGFGVKSAWEFVHDLVELVNVDG